MLTWNFFYFKERSFARFLQNFHRIRVLILQWGPFKNLKFLSIILLYQVNVDKKKFSNFFNILILLSL